GRAGSWRLRRDEAGRRSRLPPCEHCRMLGDLVPKGQAQPGSLTLGRHERPVGTDLTMTGVDPWPTRRLRTPISGPAAAALQQMRESRSGTCAVLQRRTVRALVVRLPAARRLIRIEDWP